MNNSLPPCIHDEVYHMTSCIDAYHGQDAWTSHILTFTQLFKVTLAAHILVSAPGRGISVFVLQLHGGTAPFVEFSRASLICNLSGPRLLLMDGDPITSTRGLYYNSMLRLHAQFNIAYDVLDHIHNLLCISPDDLKTSEPYTEYCISNTPIHHYRERLCKTYEYVHDTPRPNSPRANHRYTLTLTGYVHYIFVQPLGLSCPHSLPHFPFEFVRIHMNEYKYIRGRPYRETYCLVYYRLPDGTVYACEPRKLVLPPLSHYYRTWLERIWSHKTELDVNLLDIVLEFLHADGVRGGLPAVS